MFEDDDFIIPKASEIQSGNMKLVNNNDQPVMTIQEEQHEVEIPDIDIDSMIKLQESIENHDIADIVQPQTNNQPTNKPKPSTNKHPNNVIEPPLKPVQNNQNTKPIRKYYIQQLFWICNPKCESGDNLSNNEAHFVSIDFNLSFNNLKISLYEFTEKSFDNHVLFINNNKLLISGTIYPINCLRALKSEEYNFTCIEQLITQSNEPWEKERPMVVLEGNKDKIILYMYTANQKKMWYYEFVGWQKDALEMAFNYCITDGFQLSGQKVLQ